ncbi:lantibiotic dehydratase [Mucilaginibacter sp. E4BP6]|uniref:lantibiotic dehydratase n=1 Tax=Mucilaginibacter sp. E4BP6 TaxID=2723089 RepID=UPI0015CCE80B|nr:lantibiotic dehydratase [Mucilaginibacter sp. E4BP6]NYE68013.1 hypothetical protein [Mucilaginibacter sp. E4BP6]
MSHKYSPYHFFEKIILRTPYLPLGNEVLLKDVYTLLKDDFFLEAIYLASPILYHETIKLKLNLIPGKEKPRLELSLLKYLKRMTSRCTPFGLFATTGIPSWSEKSEIKYKNTDFFRHSRIDMEYLVNLSRNRQENTAAIPMGILI